MDRRQRIDLNGEGALPSGVGSPDLVRDGARELLQVHQTGGDFLPPEPGESEQIVNELAHAARVLVDDAQQPLRLGIELRVMILEQNAGEAVDRAQRSAQVVRYGVRECLQLGIRPFEGLRALGYLRFEM